MPVCWSGPSCRTGVVTGPSGDVTAHVAAWDMRGGALWLDREQWGVVIDALIEHRKGANSASNSDVRAGICADLIRTINASASGAALAGAGVLTTPTETPEAEHDMGGCQVLGCADCVSLARQYREAHSHVEIGGERMTEAQFKAARYPLLHGVASRSEHEQMWRFYSEWQGSADSAEWSSEVSGG